MPAEVLPESLEFSTWGGWRARAFASGAPVERSRYAAEVAR
jgi:hypothetical protein